MLTLEELLKIVEKNVDEEVDVGNRSLVCSLSDFEEMIYSHFSKADIFEDFLGTGENYSTKNVELKLDEGSIVTLDFTETDYEFRKNVALHSMSYLCKSIVDIIAKKSGIRSAEHLSKGYELAIENISRGFESKTIYNIAKEDFVNYTFRLVNR